MMRDNLHDLRKSYVKDALLETNLPIEPLDLFGKWFKDAQEHPEIIEANAMSVSTIDATGFPATRVVLLKEIRDDNLVFYTNYESAKGRAIAQNNRICIHFFWPELERQIIIKATAVKVPQSVSDAYFKSRPRGSQLGAWASKQSSVVASREQLDNQLATLEKQFENKEIPLPDFWGGFACAPRSFEFWQGRPNRLHDRICYEKSGGNWTFKRLSP